MSKKCNSFVLSLYSFLTSFADRDGLLDVIGGFISKMTYIGLLKTCFGTSYFSYLELLAYCMSLCRFQTIHYPKYVHFVCSWSVISRLIDILRSRLVYKLFRSGLGLVLWLQQNNKVAGSPGLVRKISLSGNNFKLSGDNRFDVTQWLLLRTREIERGRTRIA